jgi:hypothetical protein
MVDGIQILRRIHYDHFMARSNFWNDPDVMEADKLVCLAMSDLRHPDQPSYLELTMKKMRAAGGVPNPRVRASKLSATERR